VLTHVILGMCAGSRAPRRGAKRHLTAARRGHPRARARSIEIMGPKLARAPPHRWFWLGIRCEIFPRPKQWIRCPHRREGVSVRENVKIHGGKRCPRVPYSCAQIDAVPHTNISPLGRQNSPGASPPNCPNLAETPRHSRVTPGPPPGVQNRWKSIGNR